MNNSQIGHEISKLKASFSVFGFAILLMAVLAVHESAHYVSSIILGADPNQLSFRFCGINPCVSHPPFTGWQQSVIRASGGLTAGGILMFGWLKAVPSRSIGSLHWIIGFILITLGFEQIANGLVEWLANDAYRAHKVPFHLLAFVGSSFHMSLSRLWTGSWFPIGWHKANDD